MLILNVTGEISNNGSNVRILTNLFFKKIHQDYSQIRTGTLTDVVKRKSSNKIFTV